MIRSACILLALLVAGPAFAQPTVDIDFDETIEPPEDVGIDNCQQRLFDLIALTGKVTFDAEVELRVPTMRIYYFTGKLVCTRESGLVECVSDAVDSDGAACGCIYETNTLSPTNTFSTTTSLDEALGEAASSLCTSGGPDRVGFSAELYYPQQDDLAAESHLSKDSVAIVVDRMRPPAPAAAPTVAPGDSALIVRVDELSSTERYEVCVRQVGSQGTPSEAETESNETLREGFTRCLTPSDLPGSSYRFGGLTNNVNYEVVYAGIDAAGNRGPNSPAAEGMPQSQRNFAAQYTAKLGGAPGETGGCAAAPGRLPTGFALAVLGLIALIRRRCA